MGKYSHRLYISYTTFYCIGQLCAMNIPFVGFQPIKTSEHMASFGVFGLIQVFAFFGYLKSKLGAEKMAKLFWLLIGLVAAIGFGALIFLTAAGIIAPWSGRFYSLWDTGYARIHIPIISSVSEHQPTTWSSFFFDLHVLVAVFPAGLWYCVQEYNEARVFAILYAVFSAYFAGVMVRLMLTLTPIVCMLAAIAFSETFNRYLVPDEEEEEKKPQTQSLDARGRPRAVQSRDTTEDEAAMNSQLKSIVVVFLILLLFMFGTHCTWVTSNAYSSPSSVYKSHVRHFIEIFMVFVFVNWKKCCSCKSKP